MEKKNLRIINQLFSILFLMIMTFISLKMPTLILGIVVYSISYLIYAIWTTLRYKYLEK